MNKLFWLVVAVTISLLAVADWVRASPSVNVSGVATTTTCQFQGVVATSYAITMSLPGSGIPINVHHAATTSTACTVTYSFSGSGSGFTYLGNSVVPQSSPSTWGSGSASVTVTNSGSYSTVATPSTAPRFTANVIVFSGGSASVPISAVFTLHAVLTRNSDSVVLDSQDCVITVSGNVTCSKNAGGGTSSMTGFVFTPSTTAITLDPSYVAPTPTPTPTPVPHHTMDVTGTVTNHGPLSVSLEVESSLHPGLREVVSMIPASDIPNDLVLNFDPALYAGQTLKFYIQGTLLCTVAVPLEVTSDIHATFDPLEIGDESDTPPDTSEAYPTPSPSPIPSPTPIGAPTPLPTPDTGTYTPPTDPGGGSGGTGFGVFGTPSPGNPTSSDMHKEDFYEAIKSGVQNGLAAAVGNPFPGSGPTPYPGPDYTTANNNANAALQSFYGAMAKTQNIWRGAKDIFDTFVPHFSTPGASSLVVNIPGHPVTLNFNYEAKPIVFALAKFIIVLLTFIAAAKIIRWSFA